MLPRRLRRLPRTHIGGDLVALEARGFRARLLGLALLRSLPPGHALLIPRCRSVHTFGMRFAIDVRFIDDRGATIRFVEGVGRRRVLRCPGAQAVLERPARVCPPPSDG
jgi:uncharacterized membrane protein (UPF0127 family)